MNQETQRHGRRRFASDLRRIKQLAIGARDSLMAAVPDIKGATRFLDEICAKLKPIVADLPPIDTTEIEFDEEFEDATVGTVEPRRGDMENRLDREIGQQL